MLLLMTRREFTQHAALALAGAALLPDAVGKMLISNELSVQDWATRMIYFVLTDRFCDGNAANNDLGHGEYNPADNDSFQGGDLAGVRKRLPYIRSLGFDALWITPPVRNTVADPESGAKTYHGYAAYDFMEVDPHFGTLADYRALVQEAHALGIKVIQDIVVNHTGNFTGLSGHPDGENAPNDPVFRLNNPNDPAHRAAAVYNFNPAITDYNNREQTLTHSLATLDDINLNTPAARRRMLEIYRYWMQECGVDAFRIDTVYYTPPEFYDYFMENADPNDLGIRPFAKKIGKPDFLVFAETWKTALNDYPQLEEYLVSPAGKPRIDSSIDFPLNTVFSKVFFEKAATQLLADCLAVTRTNARLWVNFLDNHDVERVFNRAPWEAIQQALVCMFTLPGIPCVYYGTEHGFTVTRQNMFSEKWYTTPAKEGIFLTQLTELRRKYPVLALGKLTVDTASGQNGVISYTVTDARDALRVVFNTGTVQKYYVLSAEWEAEVLLSATPDLRVWRVGGILEPGAYVVLKKTGNGRSPVDAGLGIALLPASRFVSTALNNRRSTTGKVSPGTGNAPVGEQPPHFFDKDTLETEVVVPIALQKFPLRLLFNDGVEDARPFTWEEVQGGNLRVPAAACLPGSNTLRLMAVTPDGNRFSPALEVHIAEHFERVARVVPPEDQRKGVDDNLRPPTEASYGGQLTLEVITVWEGLRYLKVEMQMQAITDAWNPPNGFDHVYFHVLFDLPGSTAGVPFLPRLNYAPAGFSFDLGYMASGWSMVAHTAAGATPDAFGARIPAGIRSVVDKAKRTVTLVIPKSDLVAPGASLKGTKLFVATWDGYLDELRSIKPAPEDWNFSVTDGSDPAKAAKVFSFGVVEL